VGIKYQEAKKLLRTRFMPCVSVHPFIQYLVSIFAVAVARRPGASPTRKRGKLDQPGDWQFDTPIRLYGAETATAFTADGNGYRWTET